MRLITVPLVDFSSVFTVTLLARVNLTSDIRLTSDTGHPRRQYVRFVEWNQITCAGRIQLEDWHLAGNYDVTWRSYTTTRWWKQVAKASVIVCWSSRVLLIYYFLKMSGNLGTLVKTPKTAVSGALKSAISCSQELRNPIVATITSFYLSTSWTS